MTTVDVVAVGLAYALGSVPVAWIVGRFAGGVDIRERGSGNVGASNVFQSVSRRLVVPVGLAQIAQGAGAVLIARALDGGSGVQALAGVAAVVANNWNPWLRLSGGRGVGVAIGVMLVLSPVALVTFIVIALAGVAAKAIPQGVALGLVASPVAAAVAGQDAAVISGLAVIAVLVMLKRLLGNGMPDAGAPRPAVWAYRLLYDRDVRERDAWVRRRSEVGDQRSEG